MKITVNIGLNVGEKKWTKEQALEQLKMHFNVTRYKVTTGTYNGKKESTLVAEATISSGKEALNVVNALATMCVTLQQDCIAVKVGEDVGGRGINGVLAYHPRFKGERQEFDNSLFINI